MVKFIPSRNSGRSVELAPARKSMLTITLTAVLVSYVIIKALISIDMMLVGYQGIPGLVTIYAINAYGLYTLASITSRYCYPQRLDIVDGQLMLTMFNKEFKLDMTDIVVDDNLDTETEEKIKYKFDVEYPITITVINSGKELVLISDRRELRNLILEPKSIQ